MYQGTLRYDDDDEDKLDFESFIIRDNEIAFRATTTWNKYEKWLIDSNAIFNGQHYETGLVNSTQVMNSSRTASCQVIFSEVVPLESRVKVKGYWLEDCVEYHFSGSLERKD